MFSAATDRETFGSRGDGRSPRRTIEDALHERLTSLATGTSNAGQRTDVQQALLALLAREGWGEILVRMAPGGAASHTPLPIIVTGTLDIGEERDGTFVTSVYRLLDATLHSPRAAFERERFIRRGIGCIRRRPSRPPDEARPR